MMTVITQSYERLAQKVMLDLQVIHMVTNVDITFTYCQQKSV